MSWTCPICQKVYDKKNQMHKCDTTSVALLFGYDEKRMNIYADLLEKIKQFGPFNTRISSKAITLATRAGFLLIYPRKDSLELRFFLNRTVEEHPIYRVVAYTKNKFTHFTRIYDPEDIYHYLLDLLSEAYKLSN